MPRPRKPAPKDSALDKALIEAVSRGDTERLGSLIADGADPNARDEHGHPALYSAITGACAGFAVSARERRVLGILLEAGADPQLDGVGAAMVKLAWGAVCSALEANDARGLARLLGVDSDAQGTSAQRKPTTDEPVSGPVSS